MSSSVSQLMSYSVDATTRRTCRPSESDLLEPTIAVVNSFTFKFSPPPPSHQPPHLARAGSVESVNGEIILMKSSVCLELVEASLGQ